jgi:predicted acetyltransferase
MAGMRTGEVGGELRLLNTEALFDELPGVYRRVGLRRPGMIDRPDRWWTLIRQFMTRGDRNLVGVLHGPHGVEDGFVTYHVDRGERSVLNVHDLFAANDEAYRDLLRFVLGVDLVAEVRFGPSPLDAPVELLLTDRRACRVTEVEDETWLRLVDVPAALAARDYVAGEPVSIGVRDPLLPANSGTYRIGAHGVERMDTEPDLRCDVDTVATMYLGDVPASALATAGRIEVSEPKAPARADALFASPVSPWCGTFY